VNVPDALSPVRVRLAQALLNKLDV